MTPTHPAVPDDVTITMPRAQAIELRDFLIGSGKLTYTNEGIDLFHVAQKLDYALSDGKLGSNS